jgi:fructosamine-3-kinase
VTPEKEATIARVAGARPVAARVMGGGCVGDVRRIDLADGRTVVVKQGVAKPGGSGLAVEGYMLRYLAEYSTLPVPDVLHADDDLLVMTWIDSDGAITAGAEADAGELLAALHEVTADRFGFGRDTPIGGLAQPNPWTESWLAFFRDRRLLHMAQEALGAGRLAAATMARIETLAGRLERWIEEPAAPSLIHGDLWTGNVLCRAGRIAGFVDPAIHYADAEIELAFSTLFGTFCEAFFASYQRRRPLRPGFFEERRDLYNLYPLLVHVRLFGGAYLGSVERTLTRFGV